MTAITEISICVVACEANGRTPAAAAGRAKSVMLLLTATSTTAQIRTALSDALSLPKLRGVEALEEAELRSGDTTVRAEDLVMSMQMFAQLGQPLALRDVWSQQGAGWLLLLQAKKKGVARGGARLGAAAAAAPRPPRPDYDAEVGCHKVQCAAAFVLWPRYSPYLVALILVRCPQSAVRGPTACVAVNPCART